MHRDLARASVANGVGNGFLGDRRDVALDAATEVWQIVDAKIDRDIGGPAREIDDPLESPSQVLGLSAPTSSSGRVLRVKGRGVPRKDAPGDLMAKVAIVVPQRLSDEAKAAVETLRELDGGHDPRAELFEKARR